MPEINIYSKSGTKTPKKITLNKSVFFETVTDHTLLKQVYLYNLYSARENLAKTKKRGEVRGGGRKPWVQKGTGRARHGSIRSPIWAGGGVTFGPLGKENYTIKINKKAKIKAIKQALSLKNKSNQIRVIDSYDNFDKSTKKFASFLKKVEANGRILVVANDDKEIDNAARNIPKLKLIQPSNLNVFDIVNSDCILFDKKSLDILNDRLNQDSAKSAAGVKHG